MNENYLSLSTDSINLTTFIHSLNWLKGLSGSMSDHFLGCCVMFCPGAAIPIVNGPCVMPGLIMIANRMKSEMPHSTSHPFIILLEVLSSIDIRQI